MSAAVNAWSDGPKLFNRLSLAFAHTVLRAAGQADLRHGRGGSDDAFVLTAMYDKYKAMGRPVYTAAFIDFRKAYDSISRNILWESLRSMGLHGRMLESVMAM